MAAAGRSRYAGSSCCCGTPIMPHPRAQQTQAWHERDRPDHSRAGAGYPAAWQPERALMIEQVVCPVLVGREEELSALEDALLTAARGEGRVVVLSGDAGLGKTRLATELRRRAESLGAAVLWGGCSEADLALPYLPFLEAIGN